MKLSDGRYFKAGNKEALSKKLKEFVSRPLAEEEKSAQIQRIAEQYNWKDIARRTLEVYGNTVNSPQRSVGSL
jgi:glycosyltransferase involved in cell wall biosynthesis